MIYPVIGAVLLLALAVARILFLNSEVTALSRAGEKFDQTIDTWKAQSGTGSSGIPEAMPKEIQEAQVEREWIVNARDSKKESRTVWLGGVALLLVALSAAIIEVAK